MLINNLRSTNIYKFLDIGSILNSNQSGFRPNNSSMHQLIGITHDIFTASDANPSLVASSWCFPRLIKSI